MISFKAFVTAIHNAILGANESLMEQNLGLLEKYFDEGTPTNNNDGTVQGDTLKAKSVVVEYPQQTSTGIEMVPVHVPLITLVPLSMSQVEKARMEAEFQIMIQNNEIQLLFPKDEVVESKGFFGHSHKSKGAYGKLEITLAPAEMSSGLKELVEGYEKALKSQIPQ